MSKDEIRIPKCFICLDMGFILYQKKTGDISSESAAHCTCAAGAEFAYDGRHSEKNKSKYYIPSIAEVLDPIDIAAGHFRQWWEINKDKKGIEKFIQEHNIPIPREAAL